MSVHFLSTAATTAASLGSLRERAAAAAAVAAVHAAAVDRDARLPVEALGVLKDAHLMGILVPGEFGGEGASLGDVAEICHALGFACASTGMIYAMHQIKAACLVRHGTTSAWHRDFLSRMVRDQLLLASSTTEGLAGGDVRASSAPIERVGDEIRLDRDASVMSYAEAADAVVTTARASPEAGPSEQVLVVFERADYTLDPTSTWETLGMRGTGSRGFAFRARGSVQQVLETPYADIHVRTMTPAAHLLWGALWTGIASAAVERARLFNRKAARRSAGAPPIGLGPFIRAKASLEQLRALLKEALARYEALQDDPEALSSLSYQTGVTLLKVQASDLAQDVVLAALRSCGLSGYRTDGEASVERHLRDILSAPLMINNERIVRDLGLGALFAETPRSLGAGTL